MENLEIVKSFTPVITPFISSVVDVWIKPKLQDLYKKRKLSIDIHEDIFEDKFKDYLKRAFDRNNVMNTVVFQNRPKSLSDLYIPLTLSSTHGKVEVLIDKYKDGFINKYKKIVITDTAGMGKSTLLKWMFVDSMKSNVGVPIFIELRKLSEDNKVIDEIFKELNPIDGEFDRDFILNLIKRGDFIFFFDGYDEIPLESKISVTEDLQSFISKASNNVFILSSRPQSAIGSFADFHEFKIKPLKRIEAFDLLRKYDEYNTLSEQLIDIITKDKNHKSLEEFLTNPLMVSLLFKGYEYKQTISYKKSIFYRQVFDALYENHDLTKGGAFVHEKLSRLDIEQFHTVLRIFAYLTWKKGKVEYSRDEIIKYLSDAKGYSKINFMESKFLEDLIATVPLFYREGNLYRWKHKSLQEYFSAQYICTDTKELQEEILSNIYSSKDFDSYINVFDLCYDIDYKTFRGAIIYKFICEVLMHYCSSYQDFDEIDNESLLLRKQITFWKKYFIFTDESIKSKYDTKTRKELHLAMIQAKQIMEKNYEEEIKGYELIFTDPCNGLNFIVMGYEKYNFEILELLLSKGEKFIEFTRNSNVVEIPIKINEFIKPSKELKCHFICDNPSFNFNNKGNFELINQLIKDVLNFGYYKFNFDILIELKKEIENEKENLKKDELLLF
ncbi:NACHT domain-containing protein [Bacillus sp. AFS096315]|uniref:NACHT domain-containing protein n=1 Tax=Bacillus sp. AFS096315 TaxID=2033517 RepID=UPI000BEC01B6|nr:NACHT domain-containing protein [Bacillus sp. AFS096315]PEC48938.1 hypothetical protein CON00_15315 [Bacillus sp. AFS096315]